MNCYSPNSAFLCCLPWRDSGLLKSNQTSKCENKRTLPYMPTLHLHLSQLLVTDPNPSPSPPPHSHIPTFPSKRLTKIDSNPYSLVITHPTTNRSIWSLTWRDAVFSSSVCGRTHMLGRGVERHRRQDCSKDG